MVFDRKVEIDELEELETKQASDVASVLHVEDRQEVEPALVAIENAPEEPVHVPDPGAQPEWVTNLALASHYTDETLAQELVKHVHDLMADDVAALVHDRALAAATDALDPYEGFTPDFIADSARGYEPGEAPDLDDPLIVSSAHRPFLDEDSLFGGGGGGGGGAGGGGGGPPDGEGEPDEPADDPKPTDTPTDKAAAKAADQAAAKVAKPGKADPTTAKQPEPATPAKPTKPGSSKARGDDKG